MDAFAYVAELNSLYGNWLEPEVITAFVAALDGYDIAEIRYACRVWQQGANSRMPAPGQLIELIKQKRTSDLRAQQQQQRSLEFAQAQASKCTQPFKRPDGMRVLEWVEKLREQGLTSDQIAQAMCE